MGVKTLIIGAGGMVGTKLVEALDKDNGDLDIILVSSSLEKANYHSCGCIHKGK